MKIRTALCALLLQISFGHTTDQDQSGSNMIEVMVRGVNAGEFVEKMKDRVILFPEENLKLEYFSKNNDTEIFPRLKDINQTQNSLRNSRQRRNTNKVSVKFAIFFY